MKVLIIEDEPKAAQELKRLIECLRPEIHILAMTGSVEETLHWMNLNPAPDLIFSDIQLADGMSFDIFRQCPIACPVIFCTAFDEYAITAFETNGIDYLLKPIEQHKLERSLAKYKQFREMFNYNNQLRQVLERLSQQYVRTLLIHHKEKIIPVSTDDISYLHLENGIVYIQLDQHQYSTSYNLDELERILDPEQFFRANRQFIIHRKAVLNMEQYFSRKLLLRLKVPTPEPIIISKGKASTFLSWLRR